MFQIGEKEIIVFQYRLQKHLQGRFGNPRILLNICIRKKNMMQFQQEILKRKRFQLLVEHGVENHFWVPDLLWTRLGLLSCFVVIAMIKQYVRYILRFQSQYC